MFFGSQQFNERNKSTISEQSIQIVRDQISPVNENEDFLEHDQETNVEEQRNVCSINKWILGDIRILFVVEYCFCSFKSFRE